MNVFGLEVTEVLEVKPKKSSFQGVEKTVMVATIQCEGGTYRGVPIADGVEVPVGWSGKAVGYCKNELFKRLFDGNASDHYAMVPQIITKFMPVARVSRAEDALSAFVSGSAPQKSGAAELPKMPTNK